MGLTLLCGTIEVGRPTEPSDQRLSEARLLSSDRTYVVIPCYHVEVEVLRQLVERVVEDTLCDETSFNVIQRSISRAIEAADAAARPA